VQRLELLARLDAGVGAQEIDEACGVAGSRLAHDRLRCAAGEDVAPQPVAGHEAGGRRAHRLQPFELKGKVGGEVLARGALFGRVGR
jgi:hypothetical protein